MKYLTDNKGIIPLFIPLAIVLILAASTGGYFIHKKIQEKHDPFDHLTEDQIQQFMNLGSGPSEFSDMYAEVETAENQANDIDTVQKSLTNSDQNTDQYDNYTQADFDTAYEDLKDSRASTKTVTEAVNLAAAAYRQGLNYQNFLDLAQRLAQELMDQLVKQDPCEYTTKEQIEELLDNIQNLRILGAEGPDMEFIESVMREYLASEAAALGPTEYDEGFDPSGLDPNNLTWEELEHMLPTESNQYRVQLAQDARIFGLEDSLSLAILRGDTDKLTTKCPGFSVHAEGKSHSGNEHIQGTVGIFERDEFGALTKALVEASGQDIDIDYDFTLDAFTCNENKFSQWYYRIREVRTSHSSEGDKVTEGALSDQFLRVNLTSGHSEMSAANLMRITLDLTDTDFTYSLDHVSLDPVTLKGKIRRGSSRCLPVK